MGAKDCNHRPIGTFNPAYCLRPPPTKLQITCRPRNDDNSVTFSSSSSSAASSSSHDQPKKIHCRSGSDSDQPLSPKVGCMGQIKKGKGASDGSSPTKNKFIKLKRIFSGKTRMAMAMVTTTPRACLPAGDDSSVIPKISVVDLDPPLPVTKRVAGDSNSVSLWKRRCGQGLECLQLHQQQQQLCHAV